MIRKSYLVTTTVKLKVKKTLMNFLSVHGEMRFPAWIMCFVDTLQFQRLKKIRQNGNCFHVFPNANHTRFEHSLGK